MSRKAAEPLFYGPCELVWSDDIGGYVRPGTDIGVMWDDWEDWLVACACCGRILPAVRMTEGACLTCWTTGREDQRLIALHVHWFQTGVIEDDPLEPLPDVELLTTHDLVRVLTGAEPGSIELLPRDRRVH